MTAAGCCLDTAVMEGQSYGPWFIGWDITWPFLSEAAWCLVTWHWAALTSCSTSADVFWRPRVHTPSVSLTHVSWRLVSASVCACVTVSRSLRYWELRENIRESEEQNAIFLTWKLQISIEENSLTHKLHGLTKITKSEFFNTMKTYMLSEILIQM